MSRTNGRVICAESLCDVKDVRLGREDNPVRDVAWCDQIAGGGGSAVVEGERFSLAIRVHRDRVVRLQIELSEGHVEGLIRRQSQVPFAESVVWVLIGEVR